MSKLNAKCQRVLALSIVVLLQVKCFCTTSSMKYLLFAHRSLLKHQMVCAVICDSCFQCSTPRVGMGHPLSPLFPLSIHFLIFCSFLLFLSSFLHPLYLFSSFVHPFTFFYQSSPTPFSDRRSQEATEPGFSLFVLILCYCIV